MPIRKYNDTQELLIRILLDLSELQTIYFDDDEKYFYLMKIFSTYSTFVAVEVKKNENKQN